MREFLERHRRTGIVTNQPDGFDSNRPHASTIVCERPECQRRAHEWVAGTTNEPAVYVSDAARRAPQAAPEPVSMDVPLLEMGASR